MPPKNGGGSGEGGVYVIGPPRTTTCYIQGPSALDPRSGSILLGGISTSPIYRRFIVAFSRPWIDGISSIYRRGLLGPLGALSRHQYGDGSHADDDEVKPANIQTSINAWCHGHAFTSERGLLLRSSRCFVAMVMITKPRMHLQHGVLMSHTTRKFTKDI